MYWTLEHHHTNDHILAFGQSEGRRLSLTTFKDGDDIQSTLLIHCLDERAFTPTFVREFQAEPGLSLFAQHERMTKQLPDLILQAEHFFTHVSLWQRFRQVLNSFALAFASWRNQRALDELIKKSPT